MKRAGVIAPGGVVNLHRLWDWIGMALRIGPEFPSCTFPLGWPVSRKAGKKNLTGTTNFKYEREKRNEFWPLQSKDVVVQMAHFSSSIVNKDA